MLRLVLVKRCKGVRLWFGVALLAMLAAPLMPAPARAAGEPGDFDYYTLVLNWSPSFCATSRRNDNGPQCAGEKPYSFILHGLWPQFYRSYPEFCRTRKREWVSNEIIAEMMDIMPGKGLIIHQYRKHGSCSGLSPEQYFGISRTLYESIKIPERYKRPDAPVNTTPDEVEKAFMDANPQLNADMLAVSCKGEFVQEVRVCFSRDRKPTKCGSNEDQGRICRRDKIVMPPVQWRPSGI
ncbi:MAG: ribonuclease [Hyphomicrobiales bacterium]|nr:ribonuclease [Hyphomicrobiales bacterium]